MSITVAQTLEIAPFRHSTVRAGGAGLQRTFEHVRAFDAADAPSTDRVLYVGNHRVFGRDHADQCASIARLHECGSAGLVIEGATPFAPEALRLADHLTFPVIELAADVPCAEIVASVTVALAHEHNAALERRRQFQQQLIDLMLRGFGLDHLLNATATRLRRPVLVLGSDGETVATAGLDDQQRQHWHQCVAHSRPTRPRIFALAGTATHLWIAPLPGTQRPGWFATLHDDSFDRETQNTVEQGCELIALSMLKHEQVATDRRMRQAELLDALLEGRAEHEEQMLHEAEQVGWDLRRCRGVILVRGTGDAPASISFADVARRACMGSIVSQRGDETVVLVSLSGSASAMRDALRDTAQRLLEAIPSHEQRRYAISVGSIVASPLALHASYRAATGTLRVREHLPNNNGIVQYEDAQLLVMLDEFAAQPNVRDWLHSQLGTLLDYDQRNKTTLVQTLEAALDEGGVLTVTAERLCIHPNTLKYRLQRIEEILEVNPMSSPHRLNFHTASKLARLLA